ncbi:MAG: RNA polymerase factor sigma-54 [Bacteroidales bacterium]|nr:RNA polymerase factor sigma-54 [Candidatus Physcousia equi]
MQHLTQTQNLQQTQQQTLSMQQVVVAQLTQLSVEELRARIDKECLENPYLERKNDGTEDGRDELAHTDGVEEGKDEENFDESGENAQLDDVDWEGNEFPTTVSEDGGRRMENGEKLSFHDMLLQQIGEYELSKREQFILEYLIGSLDADGLLRTPLRDVEYELDVYHDITTNHAELERLLTTLQDFEPAGVGARNLIECLLIQARRNTTLPMRQHLVTMLERYGEDVRYMRWDAIQNKMKLTDGELASMRHALRRLNPRPGGSIGAASYEQARTIVPDFIVEVDDEGRIRFQLSEPGIPKLAMSEDLSIWIDEHKQMDERTARRDVREELRYKRKFMEMGNLFINALAQRRQTLINVMGGIIRLQEDFFREGIETLLRPMKLEDVAVLAAVDISTVSRVCRSKTVQTPYGHYPLRWFFTSSTQKEGEQTSVHALKVALRELVDAEDKRRPLSDDALTKALQEKGFDIARRTVAKYREIMNIPTSRMRR